MFRVIEVALHERAIVFHRGLPREALGPGRHVRWGFHLDCKTFDTRELLFTASPEERAVIPASWFDEVTVGIRERAIVHQDGVPRVLLRPGLHRFWTLDPSVFLTLLSVDEPMPELTDELRSVIPPDEYVDVVIEAHQMGLKLVQGRLTETLTPGRYTLWSHPGAEVAIRTVDMRRRSTAIVGQELMTRDKVTLRLSLTVEHAIEDPALAATRVADPEAAVYLLVQLAARDYVSSVSLDQLLEGRDAMKRFLEEAVRADARGFGVAVERVGVKDVVLPGDMKALLNRVIEAEKEAAANVILRREETAATRSLANTAKVMADNPVLLRLKELESLKDIAERIGEVRLVMGSDKLGALLPAGLLGGGADGRR